MQYRGSRAQHIAAGSAVAGCFAGLAITQRLIGEPESWLHIAVGVMNGGLAAACIAFVLDRLLPGDSSRRNVETQAE